MRSRPLHLCSLILLTLAAFGQTTIPRAPVPADPHELATGETIVASDAGQRASVLSLLERARQNADLQAPGAPGFTLKVSFEASGPVTYTGSGEMTDTWMSAGMWGWSARLGDYSEVRAVANGRVYGENPAGVVPLRVQMVRGAIFWPINVWPRALIRVATGNWNGMQLMCALQSAGAPTATPGRRWGETEYCVDPKSGLLQIYSVAPGIYGVYDYNGALRFHGHVLPRQITVFENGSAVLNIHLESIGPASGIENASFNFSAATTMPVWLTMPVRFPQVVPTPGAPANATIEPVIVHASISKDGKVVEAEALQTSAQSRAALDLVKRSTYPPRNGNGFMRQREAFINVQFVPGGK